MGKNRIIYKNWASEQKSEAPHPDSQNSDHDDLIASEIRAAIAKLEPLERILIERYYLQFEELTEIADSLNLTVYRIETVHARALKKLRKLLGPFVDQHFGLRPSPGKRCPICQSPQRDAIESLISSRDPKRPWRILLRRIRHQFGTNIRTYHVIQTHQRFH